MRLLTLSSNLISQCRHISSSSSGITKIHRAVHARTYPVLMILPDGSSINVRHHEPRQIIKMPFDIRTLSDVERKARIDARKPRQKVRIEEEVEDTFKSKRYLKFIKK